MEEILGNPAICGTNQLSSMRNSQPMSTSSEQRGLKTKCTRPAKSIAVPSTLVETDCHNFMELVQKLTGVSDAPDEKKLPVSMSSRNLRKSPSVARMKSHGNRCALPKSGIEVGPQKPAFKLLQRRQFKKKLQVELGFGSDHHSDKMLAGNKDVLSPMVLPALTPSPITPVGLAEQFTSLTPSPITPVGLAEQFTSSSRYCYNNHSPPSCSTPTYCNQSSYLEEEEEFSFQPSPVRLKMEPKLLPLFPLHSTNQPNN